MDFSFLNSRYMYLLVFVDLVLKGFALWDSARKGRKFWFVALLLINSLGLFPLTYLLYFRKEKNKNKILKDDTSSSSIVINSKSVISNKATVGKVKKINSKKYPKSKKNKSTR